MLKVPEILGRKNPKFMNVQLAESEASLMAADPVVASKAFEELTDYIFRFGPDPWSAQTILMEAEPRGDLKNEHRNEIIHHIGQAFLTLVKSDPEVATKIILAYFSRIKANQELDHYAGLFDTAAFPLLRRHDLIKNLILTSSRFSNRSFLYGDGRQTYFWLVFINQTRLETDEVDLIAKVLSEGVESWENRASGLSDYQAYRSYEQALIYIERLRLLAKVNKKDSIRRNAKAQETRIEAAQKKLANDYVSDAKDDAERERRMLFLRFGPRAGRW